MESDLTDLGCPLTLRVAGRVGRENSDICGEYVRGSLLHHGRPVYYQQGSTTVIRYWPHQRRWVIDREGIRDSDVCVAFAPEDGSDFEHPAHAQLIWWIWESAFHTFVQDAEVISTSAPKAITLVGRGQGRECDWVNGSYELRGVCHGRPAYVHSQLSLTIRYLKEDNRWLLSDTAQDGPVCRAFAEAGSSEHPGHPQLDWWFVEPQLGTFVFDADTRTLDAPATVQVIGRHPEAANARVNGSYALAGIMDGRPAYVQPGTRKLIRYSSRTDRWLIDADGLLEPSLASRLYYWIFRGDLNAAGDRCIAFAEAYGAEHPGLATLDWHVWESSTFVPDPWVRCTTAPLALQVRGRAAGRENGFLNGEYVLIGTHNGRPAYQKRGSNIVIRHWPPNRWLIDCGGLRVSDACTAWAESSPDSAHPADRCSVWYVWESCRGCHVQDPCIDVLPLAFAAGDDAIGGADRVAAGGLLVQPKQQEAYGFLAQQGGIRQYRSLYGA
eukprot:gb/GFBE01065565.1/.p1 GENE.gb/GFBE01065565.1/~~gb/GFBE01065565.1/.p1  ORF type:complete len:497 (+),score=55.70 gb/GFBE01065565.1/:1-1491(+)